MDFASSKGDAFYCRFYLCCHENESSMAEWGFLSNDDEMASYFYSRKVIRADDDSMMRQPLSLRRYAYCLHERADESGELWGFSTSGGGANIPLIRMAQTKKGIWGVFIIRKKGTSFKMEAISKTSRSEIQS